jgi:hypothetical protein
VWRAERERCFPIRRRSRGPVPVAGARALFPD